LPKLLKNCTEGFFAKIGCWTPTKYFRLPCTV